MNIFVCLISSIGIIIILGLIGTIIEFVCDKLNIDTLVFVGLLFVIFILTLVLYTLTN